MLNIRFKNLRSTKFLMSYRNTGIKIWGQMLNLLYFDEMKEYQHVMSCLIICKTSLYQYTSCKLVFCSVGPSEPQNKLILNHSEYA